MDTVSQHQRSKNMAAIKAKNTKPERMVRRFLHAHGLRYRLHVADLPGKPDLVFPRCSAVVFVHGCFWHQCPHCRVGARPVRSNTGYWAPKLARNGARDAAAVAALRTQGWRVFVIWECQADDPKILRTLAKALAGRRQRTRLLNQSR
jgi:DNA mismatch endonuclease (patch repair protein)